MGRGRVRAPSSLSVTAHVRTLSAGVRFDDVRFDIAVRIAGPLWRAGCWLRASALAGCWALLLLAPPMAALRGAAALTVSTLAVGLAFVHTSAAALDALARVPGAGRLADHLSSTQGRATVDASGIGEGIGVLLVMGVFAGPFPIDGLPLPARITGVVLGQCYVWDAVLQAMIDPSWYNARRPPSPALRRLRWAMPMMLVAAGVVVLGPWSEPAREIPVAVRLLLAGTPVLYYPAWATVDLLLRAATEQIRTSEENWRDDIASDLHSAVKNPLTLLQTHLSQPDPPLEESRSLIREARISIEDLRRQLQTPLDDVVVVAGARPFEELWATIQRILPATHRARCTLRAGAGSVLLHSADRQLLQRVLADLLTNALTHGGRHVQVDLRLTAGPAVPARLHLQVDDDGPGLPGGVLAEHRSSLRLLRDRLVRLGGALDVGPAPGGHVTASWPAHTAGAITWAPSGGPAPAERPALPPAPVSSTLEPQDLAPPPAARQAVVLDSPHPAADRRQQERHAHPRGR